MGAFEKNVIESGDADLSETQKDHKKRTITYLKNHGSNDKVRSLAEPDSRTPPKEKPETRKRKISAH